MFQILHTLCVCHKNQLSCVTFKNTYTHIQTLSLFRLHDFACMRRHTYIPLRCHYQPANLFNLFIYSCKGKVSACFYPHIQRESHKCERDRLYLSIFIVMCVFYRISASNVLYTCVLEEIYYFPSQKCIKDAKIKCETFIRYTIYWHNIYFQTFLIYFSNRERNKSIYLDNETHVPFYHLSIYS